MSDVPVVGDRRSGRVRTQRQYPGMVSSEIIHDNKVSKGGASDRKEEEEASDRKQLEVPEQQRTKMNWKQKRDLKDTERLATFPFAMQLDHPEVTIERYLCRGPNYTNYDLRRLCEDNGVAWTYDDKRQTLIDNLELKLNELGNDGTKKTYDSLPKPINPIMNQSEILRASNFGIEYGSLSEWLFDLVYADPTFMMRKLKMRPNQLEEIEKRVHEYCHATYGGMPELPFPYNRALIIALIWIRECSSFDDLLNPWFVTCADKHRHSIQTVVLDIISSLKPSVGGERLTDEFYRKLAKGFMSKGYPGAVGALDLTVTYVAKRPVFLLVIVDAYGTPWWQETLRGYSSEANAFRNSEFLRLLQSPGNLLNWPRGIKVRICDGDDDDCFVTVDPYVGIDYQLGKDMGTHIPASLRTKILSPEIWVTVHELAGEENRDLERILGPFCVYISRLELFAETYFGRLNTYSKLFKLDQVWGPVKIEAAATMVTFRMSQNSDSYCKVAELKCEEPIFVDQPLFRNLTATKTALEEAFRHICNKMGKDVPEGQTKRNSQEKRQKNILTDGAQPIFESVTRKRVASIMNQTQQETRQKSLQVLEKYRGYLPPHTSRVPRSPIDRVQVGGDENIVGLDDFCHGQRR